MCGNGGRCIVGFAKYLGIIDDKCTFLAADGIHSANISDNKVSLSMNNVSSIESLGNKVFILDTGSPHYVTIVDDVRKVNVTKEGAMIRNSKRFIQEGINVNFLQIADCPIIRSYERGVENETLSCGTGTVACAIVSHKINSDNSGDGPAFVQKVITQGGNLEVKFRLEHNIYTDIYLSGTFSSVFSGSFIC